MSIAKPLALLPVVSSLIACAAPDGAYPSLAIREAERVSGTMEAPAPPALPSTAPAIQTNAAQLAATARAAHEGFLTAAPATRTRVNAANSAAIGSDRWSAAQVAIAELETQRSEVMIALADLDRLAVEAAVAGEDFAALAASRDEIAALAASETALIELLLATLPR